MRIDQGGITPGHFVRQTLKMPLHGVLELKKSAGIMFVELNATGIGNEAICHSKLYWLWWCKVWHKTDLRLLNCDITSKNYVDAHTRIIDPAIMVSFKNHYDGFVADGLAMLKEGGLPL